MCQGRSVSNTNTQPRVVWISSWCPRECIIQDVFILPATTFNCSQSVFIWHLGYENHTTKTQPRSHSTLHNLVHTITTSCWSNTQQFRLFSYFKDEAPDLAGRWSTWWRYDIYNRNGRSGLNPGRGRRLRPGEGARTEPLGEFGWSFVIHIHIRRWAERPVMTAVIRTAHQCNSFSVGSSGRAISFPPRFIMILHTLHVPATRYRRLALWTRSWRGRAHTAAGASATCDWWAASSSCCYVTLRSITRVGVASLHSDQWDASSQSNEEKNLQHI